MCIIQQYIIHTVSLEHFLFLRQALVSMSAYSSWSYQRPPGWSNPYTPPSYQFTNPPHYRYYPTYANPFTQFNAPPQPADTQFADVRTLQQIADQRYDEVNRWKKTILKLKEDTGAQKRRGQELLSAGRLEAAAEVYKEIIDQVGKFERGFRVESD